MYVCLCHGVTDREIREAAAAGAREMVDLAAMTGCGTGCGSCGELAQTLLQEARRERNQASPLPLPMLQAAA
jgi:bacterioferritin-associated ferredoxin